MTVQYNEVQELLRSRADLQARLNLMPYDGTPEIKERGGGKYLYVRKRVVGNKHQRMWACMLKNYIICFFVMPENHVK